MQNENLKRVQVMHQYIYSPCDTKLTMQNLKQVTFIAFLEQRTRFSLLIL